MRSSGVILGHVQPGKAVIVVLDLGALIDLKAHPCKSVDDLVAHQRQGMQPAGGTHLGGQGDIHRFGGVAGGQLQLVDPGGCLVIIRLHLLFQLVDGLAHGGTVGGSHHAQILHQGGDLSVLAQVLLPESRQGLFGGHLRQVCLGLLCQLIYDCLHTFPLLFQSSLVASGRNRKGPRPLPAKASQGTEPCRILRGTTQIPRRCEAARHSNAVTGHAVPHYRAAESRLSRRPLGSELPRCRLREPFQPVELLSGTRRAADTFSVIAFYTSLCL